MADIYHGTTQLANWLPTVFAPAMEGYFQSQKTLSNFCTDYSSLLAAGAKAVSVPMIGQRTADSKSTQTALEYTGYASAESSGTITVDQTAAEAFLFEDIAQLQTNLDLLNTYAMDSAYVLTKAFESYLAGIVQTATTNDITLATDNTILWTDVLAAYRKLKIAGVDIKQCAFGMSPEAFELSVASWGTKYTSAAELGGSSFAYTGAEGILLGMPIYVSDDWDGDGGAGDETATIWHPRSVGYAIQGGIRVKGPVPVPTHVADGVAYAMHYGASKLIDSGIVNFNNA